METIGLAETINALRDEGYTEDFNLSGELLHTVDSVPLADDEFVVDRVYRFDVMSDPGDQSVLYAIHAIKSGRKGILVNGFGVYSEQITNQKLKSLHRW